MHCTSMIRADEIPAMASLVQCEVMQTIGDGWEAEELGRRLADTVCRAVVWRAFGERLLRLQWLPLCRGRRVGNSRSDDRGGEWCECAGRRSGDRRRVGLRRRRIAACGGDGWCIAM